MPAAVQLRRHRAAPAPTVRDLDLVQDAVQHALDQLGAYKLTSVDISGGAISSAALGIGVVFDANVATLAAIQGSKVADASIDGSAKIEDGTVTAAKLTAQLRQGFHAACAASTAGQAPGTTNLQFGIQSFGDAQWSDHATLALGVACNMHIHGRLLLFGGSSGGGNPNHFGGGSDTDSPLVPGARAQFVMLDDTGAVVLAGPWTQAELTSDGIVQIEAPICGSVVLAASGTHTYHFRFNAQEANGNAPASWGYAAPNLIASPPIGGSFVDGIVVPT